MDDDKYKVVHTDMKSVGAQTMDMLTFSRQEHVYTVENTETGEREEVTAASKIEAIEKASQ